jgi:hypothetical protein
VPNGWPVLPIHIRSDGSVDNESVNVSQSRHEEVVWSSENGVFEIQFEKTPFEHTIFQVPARGSIRSGPVRGELGTYPYTISSAETSMSADPLINVVR